MLLLEYNPTKKLNRRQRAYRKNRILGMNQYNAARAAGYSENYSKIACRIEKTVKDSMADLMQQAGLTDEFMIAYAKLGLEASKLTAFGRSCDWGSRHKFYETLMKMSGKLKTTDIAINNGDVVTNVRNEIVYVFSGSRKEVEANARKRESEKAGVQSLHDSESASGNRCEEAL